MSRHRRQQRKRARNVVRLGELARRAGQVVRGAMRPKGWVLFHLIARHEKRNGDLVCDVTYCARGGLVASRTWRVQTHWLYMSEEMRPSDRGRP